MAKRQPSIQPGLTRKQTSRAKREARIQRIVLITAGVIGAAVVLLIAYGLRWVGLPAALLRLITSQKVVRLIQIGLPIV